MIYFDLALRSGGVTVLLLLALLMWRAPIGLEGRLSVMALAVTESAFLIKTMALPLDLHPLLQANLDLFASLTPITITWLIVSIFLDAPRRRWPLIMASVVTSVAYFAHNAFPILVPVCLVLGVCLYAALVLLALWTARDDLVECRCRARPAFAAAIAGMALLLTGTQALGLFEENPAALPTLHAAGTFVLSIVFAVWLLRPDADRWPGEIERPADRPVDAAAQNGLDTALIERIRAAMTAGIWREEGLTIGALASKLNVPEHRARRAINKGLGHRNFSSFINRARIEAACDVLGDPARMSTTVLEIAYDVGFSSVGPFNRAFRAEKGLSPTEYRRRALAGDIADSGRSSSIPVNLH